MSLRTDFRYTPSILPLGRCSPPTTPAWTRRTFAASPVAPGYGPGHLHGVNMVDGVIWVPGFGCQLQGWNSLTSQLVANLTGLCNNIPGNVRQSTGAGHCSHSVMLRFRST